MARSSTRCRIRGWRVRSCPSSVRASEACHAHLLRQGLLGRVFADRLLSEHLVRAMQARAQAGNEGVFNGPKSKALTKAARNKWLGQLVSASFAHVPASAIADDDDNDVQQGYCQDHQRQGTGRRTRGRGRGGEQRVKRQEAEWPEWMFRFQNGFRCVCVERLVRRFRFLAYFDRVGEAAFVRGCRALAWFGVHQIPGWACLRGSVFTNCSYGAQSVKV